MANTKDFVVKNGIQAGANSSIAGSLAVGNTTVTGSISANTITAGNAVITGTLSTTGNTAITGNLTFNTATAGAWNGSVISGQYGGTGVNNSGKTITLGGNINTANSLMTSGNFAANLIFTAATNITFPTTGTLATIAGTETLTNKTLTSPTINAGALSGTFSGNPTFSGYVTTSDYITVNMPSSTNNDGLRIQSGTLASGNPGLIIKKQGATDFRIISWNGTANEGSLALTFPAGVSTSANLSVGGTLNVTGDLNITGTLSGTIANANNSTYLNGQEASYYSNASNISTGTLATARGGTGLTLFTSGGAVYASNTSALTTGTLPVTAGGTGVTTSTGTGSTVLSISPSFSGNTTFDSTTLAIDATNNRVGIGTIAPKSPLHVDVSGLSDLIDTVRISHNSSGNTFGPALVLQRDSASPANNDAIGYIAFRGNNGAGNASDYAWIQSYIRDTTALADDGELALAVKKNGAYAEIVNIANNGIAVTGNVVASGSMSISTGQIISGTYTPTLTGVTNIATSSAQLCNYMRVGDIVTVSGGISVNVTAAATNSEIGISLPIASAFTAFQHCGGVGSPTNATYSAENGSIYGDGTNDRATMSFKPSATGSRNYAIHFTYRII